MKFNQYTNVTEIVIPDKVHVSQRGGFCQSMDNLKTARITANCITTFNGAFAYYRNLVSPSPIGDSVISMSEAYRDCYNLTSSVCGQNVIDMTFAYFNCTNLSGSAECGAFVKNMPSAYQGCKNLSSAACGDNVLNFSSTYSGCSNLTKAACGNNVTSMLFSYSNCTNLTTAVCGPNVTNMHGTYRNCTNLTTAVCGPKVSALFETYKNCPNIQGNFYIYSSISNYRNCFGGRNTSNRLNIYVHSGFPLITNTSSLVGKSITWTNERNTNGYYYNAAYNIYIYPVANVEKARIANGD